MRKPKDCDCLPCQLVKTIMKYGKKHGTVADIEIVGVLAAIIAEVVVLQDHDMQTRMRDALCRRIDEQIASAVGPQRLHS